jgi:hypothetical protein
MNGDQNSGSKGGHRHAGQNTSPITDAHEGFPLSQNQVDKWRTSSHNGENF